MATDEDDDVLTYTLTDADGGTDGDSASFAIDWATGQLMAKAALNFEDTPSYTVVVRATDPSGVPQASTAVAANSDEVTVVITVTDVNEAPAVAGDAAVTFNEDTGDITNLLDDYMATDPDAGAPTPTWSVAGPDGDKFTAVDGELKFKAKPDHENPTDANTDNVYEVTAQASDGKLTGMKKVKVTVENADEGGVVTLSKTQPRVGIAVTASLTDPDGSISSLTWQWSNDDGDIADANSDTYEPGTGDVGDTLTATASYTDGHGSGKTADQGSANDVAEDTRNKPPAFADQDAETDGVQNDMATRKVDENTEAVAADDALADGSEDVADNVGAVVMATDPDPNAETPTYTLGGADAAKFRVRANGQIEVGSGTELDYETKPSYMVTLTAEDSFGSSSSIDVTIMVNPIDEAPVIMRAPDANVAPEFASDTTSRTVAENTVAGEDIGNPVAASDANRDTLTYALSGTNAESFDIDRATGQLMTKMALDFETKPTYSVTVTASDSGGLSDSIDVMVMVTNEDDDGTVILSPMNPVVDVAFSASLTDRDMLTENTVTWQWSKSMEKDGAFMDIDGATSASYTPVATDVDYYLRATATYTDGHGPGKSEDEVTANAVAAEGTAQFDPLSYDAVNNNGNGNGEIDRREASNAIFDFFDKIIDSDELGEVLGSYLFG